MYKNYMLFIYLIIFIIIQGCGQDQHIDASNLEKLIITKIQDDAPYIAQLETIYLINYIKFKDNSWLSEDDAYIRDDEARVYYGFNINKSNISIENIHEKMTLHVKLPKPEQISIDRKIKSLHTNNPNTKLESDGKQVDTEYVINNNLNRTIKKYEAKSLKMTETVTRQYFEAIANRYNLNLHLEFAPQ